MRPRSESTPFAVRTAAVAVIAATAGLVALPGCSQSTSSRGPTTHGTPRAANSAPVRQLEEAETAYQRGAQFYREGDLRAALQEFERAIDVNPNLVPAYIGAGQIYKDLREYQKAESRLATATKLDPSNFDAAYLHALVLQLGGKVDAAVRGYLRALELQPDDFEANLNIATAYIQLNEPAQAIVYAQRAVRLDTSSGVARANLGAIYARLGRHADAVIEYQQAAELMDLTPGLLLNLADSLGRSQRYPEMLATLDQLIRIKPSAMAHERRGSALFRLRRYDEALSAFRAALAIDPNHYPAHNGVAVCMLNQYLWSGQTDRAALAEATRALQASLRAQPKQDKIVTLLNKYGRDGAIFAGAEGSTE